ncbi:MAG: bifunctional D-glycero-beta-D-manno-heptose-7-phosphate kinase/D-glycero-beta-D-manno-heptose 1-phosphate adenylyltransferase HldE [Gammaproteobacteria bacterium]|nr:bifunctional D-glycero-beta-D-manno-heptose-7-phosphate kinase/D-glycero-beta-D-manno-heptose 1-phosphate adenylyltransferase HldE [Gammaproteobacteria bacterium]
MHIQLPDFSKGRVLVVGDLMLDRYWQGPAARISPEAPVPVVRIDQIEERPGGAANVALNLRSLGIQVHLAGVVGEDDAGVVLEKCLRATGVECQLQHAASIPTITKLRVISRHQQLIRLDFEQSLGTVDISEMQAHCLQAIAGCDALVLSDYAKGTLQRPQELIEAARSARIPVLVDPKGVDFERYSGATLLTPNLSEFESVVGHCGSDRVLVERGEQLRSRLQLEALLITLGERGMLLLPSGGEALHLPTRAREVFDVTGAGDTVIALLAAGIASGMKLTDAAGVANMAAGMVVAKLGAGSVTLTELRSALRQQENWGPVVDRQQLKLLLEEARNAGERIVMTNGCFDILHEGHVTYLQQARKLGDRLLVAVNDDDSVRRLKGEGRPINTLQQRMAVLAGLASVDWVVAFSEDTPERLICDVKPDLLVKGGDYRPEQIAGYDCVTANGGEVRVLSYLDGRSTSRILESIRRERETQ